jgi:segregation and condensation protein B
MRDVADQEAEARNAPLPGLNALPEDDLPALVEALLLVAPDPVAIADLAEVAGVAADAIKATIAAMERQEDRGWVIVRHHDTVHFASAPRFSAQVRRLLRLDREPRLSGAALETLALIAYRQPVTRAEIESLRGVDCAGVLSTLHGRGLVEIVGRLPTVGNPIQYGTSVEFLRQFGLRSLEELPPLDELMRASGDHAAVEFAAAAHGMAESLSPS